MGSTSTPTSGHRCPVGGPVRGTGARRTIPGSGASPASGARSPRRPSGRPSSPRPRAGGRPPGGSGPPGAGWTTSSRRRSPGGCAGPAGRAATPARGGTAAGAATGCGIGSVECRTSTSTCSGKMRNETWIAPVGPAASSRARKTVSPTSRLPSSVSGDSARQRRTKSRISGIQDGRAGNVCDSTTTGTTSIGPSPGPWFRSGTAVSPSHSPASAGSVSRLRAADQTCPLPGAHLTGGARRHE